MRLSASSRRFSSSLSGLFMSDTAYPETNDGLFATAKTKVLRARQFIAELAAEAERYKASDPVSISFRPPSQMEIFWKATTLKPGAIAGDALHNLRASLDLAACELARANGESDKNVHFPFAERAEDLDLMVKTKNFRRAGPDAVRLLHTLKPYTGGNIALRALHDLDVQDKHRTIGIAGSQLIIQARGIYHIDAPADGQFEADLSSFHYVFSDGPFAQQPVIETLHKLVELVEGILEAFAALIAARA